MDNQNETQVTVTNNEEVKNEEVKQDDTASTGTPDLSKMSEADKRAFFAVELQNSAIENQFGKTETIVVNEGTKYQYHMILAFPGTAIASQIEDDATTDATGITKLMQSAIDNGVISFPQVKSLDFWNYHKGYSEVAGKVLNFLNNGLAGNLE